MCFLFSHLIGPFPFSVFEHQSESYPITINSSIRNYVIQPANQKKVVLASDLK